MTRPSFVACLSGGVGLAALAMLPAPGFAQGAAVHFDIPAQPMANAVRAVGSRAGVNIVFGPNLTAGRRAPAVRGTMTAREAIRRLLAGSNLTVDQAPGGGLFLRPISMVSAQGRAVATPISADGPDPAPPPEPVPVSVRAAEPSIDAADIVVTGSRIARSGFTAPTPVTVVGADQMQELGITNVGDALNQLPSFRATSTPATNAIGGGNIGARFADLRGIGSSRTLVLVDGQRFVPSTLTGQVDLNLIPSALVARSEVVTGGASAQYGSDAVAGVVNFILDTRFEGVRGQMQYGITQAGDNATFQASLGVGRSFLDGRLRVIVGGEYEDSKGTGDCMTRDWCIAPVVVANPKPGANGMPAQIIGPGRTASSSIFGLITGPDAVKGTTFTPDGQPRQFTYGQYPGIFMLGGEDDYRNTFREGVLLSVPVRRYSGLTHAELELSHALTAFAEFSYGRTQGTSVGAQKRDINGALTIRSDNAFIPAALHDTLVANDITSFKFGRLETDIGHAINSAKADTYRAVGGVKGNLFGNWTWNAYYQYGSYKNVARILNDVIVPNFNAAIDAVAGPGGTIVCRSSLPGEAPVANASAGCSPLNLFGYNRFSPEAKAYVVGTAWGETKINQNVLAATFQGAVVDLPAGPLAVAFGGEYRRDHASTDNDLISRANLFYSNAGQPVSGTVKVTEGFIEAEAPLLRNLALVHSLEVNGAVRRTRYNTSGSVTTWKVGGVYEPVNGLRLRATRSRDIRAPNITELFSPSNYSCCTSIRDPRDGSPNFIPTAAGGNRGLMPEKADTFTAGMVLQPAWEWSRGLRLSVDYYRIRIDDVITSIGAQTIVNRCFAGATELCALVGTNPNGTLASVLNNLRNINQLRTSGYDIELDYRLPLSRLGAGLGGTLHLRALATHAEHLTTRDSAGSVDRAGMTGWPLQQQSGVPSWTGDLTATYEDGPLSLTLQAHFIDSGIYDVNSIGPSQKGYSPTLINSINDNTVPSRTYISLNGQYEVAKGISMYAGVSNIFNVDPPQYPGQQDTNTQYFDQLGRAFRVGVRFRL